VSVAKHGVVQFKGRLLSHCVSVCRAWKLTAVVHFVSVICLSMREILTGAVYGPHLKV